jgi:hypothetical protein
MDSAEARIVTDRADRYLTQVCEHLAAIGQNALAQGGHDASPDHAPRVEWSDSHAVVHIGDAQFTLDVTADALLIRVEAPDPAGLEGLKQLLTQRIQTIGRRDGLAVNW